MKNVWMFLVVILSLSMMRPDISQAQILKGFGKKVENKLKKKVEEKADRHVDKTINTADRKSDESIEQAVKGDGDKSKNNKKDKQKTKITQEDIPVRKDQAMNMFRSTACNDFLWFKTGSVFEYEHDAKGSRTEVSSMRVNGVTQSGGKTISEIVANQNTPEGDMELTLHYVCDGDNFYIDMSAMYEQIMQQMEGQSGGDNAQVKEMIDSAEIDVSDGFTTMPKVLYPGLKLPDASFSFTMSTSGMEVVMNSNVTDRVVVGKETVTTKAGTFECMKIRSTTSVDMNMMGRNINTGNSTDYVWLAPEVGMVKQESHSKNKLDYTMTLSRLER
ncbi:MAG TPA: hypothetical protein VKX30_06540 [Flavobacteriaceae bacterium]|nr:hypothetical protein [Flavobacteriaceae bacterium]